MHNAQREALWRQMETHRGNLHYYLARRQWAFAWDCAKRSWRCWRLLHG